MAKHAHSTHAHAPKKKELNIRAGILAVAMASFLIIIKFYAWAETNSLSIFSSLIDSSLDVITSGINLIAIGYALKPADDDHPYGHDAIEDIVGLLQAAFIFGSAFFISYESIQRFIKPIQISDSTTGIVVMLISIAFTVALVIYQKMTVRKTKSIVVESDSLHYVTDILSGALVIISLIASRSPEFHYIDPLLAILIAVYLTHGAFGIGKRAFDNLMDKEISAKDKLRIVEIINENKKHNGFHGFKTRTNGNKMFIQFDLEMDGELTLQQAHDIAEELMKAIMKEFGNSEVTIHLDPEDDQL